MNTALRKILEAIGSICAACAELRRRWSSTCYAIIGAGLAVLCLAVPGWPQSREKVAASGASVKGNLTAATPGNEACAKCHSAIFETYVKTPMARGSGPATQGFLPGEFVHATSGVRYRVYLEKGEVWMSFDREGDEPLHGKRKLEYFIGSGHRGKTFTFSDEGFSFELPINFYSLPGGAPGGMWDMQPKSQGAKEMPLTAPAASSCLSCHTSGAQAPEAGTENKYGSPLFAHGGITCERCHGGDTSHGLSAKKSNKGDPGNSRAGSPVRSGIINPAKLTASRRDAVCMQCHLEGNAAIQQPGRHFYEFRPGDDLSDFVRYYVYSGDGKDNVRAVSQFEALAQSKCKRATGDAMTCTTCHNPHASPSVAERVAYFRGKCLTCHGEAFGSKHHVEQQNCAACHMQRLSTMDVGHTQASDHRILRVPLQSAGPANDVSPEATEETKLARFPPVEEETVRGVALAWTSLAGTGSKYAFEQSEKFLPEALAQQPEDPDLLAALGFSEQQRGLTEEARKHYEHALRVNPLSLDAGANLALIEANAGNLDRAAELWKSVFTRAPGRSSSGINLARVLCLSGHDQEARAAIGRVLEFNPDSSIARGMLKQLDSGEVKCTGE